MAVVQPVYLARHLGGAVYVCVCVCVGGGGCSGANAENTTDDCFRPGGASFAAHFRSGSAFASPK